MLYLQEHIGNRAVQRLIQAKLQSSRNVIQRFDEGEHKSIGDAATNKRPIDLAPGLTVTYGDVVSLGGDYFGEWETISKLSHTEGITEGTRGEIWYALLVKIRVNAEGGDEKAAETKGLGKLFDLKAKAAVEKRFNNLAVKNIAHFPNPRKGDAGRSVEEKDSGPNAIGGGATYRQNHAQALMVAAAIGQTKYKSSGRPKHYGTPKDGLNDALFIEAFADHFLTDAFSAGHQQTERASIKDYWDSKVPDFYTKFQHWLAEGVTLELRKHPKSTKSKVGSHITPQFVTEEIALPQVQAAMANLPKLGFGDIVSGAIHDYFNANGVQATVARKPIELVGDKNLLTQANPSAGSEQNRTRHVTDKSKDTFNAAAAAVQAGIQEVYHAFELGQQGEDPTMVADKILKDGKGLFAAEKLMPTLTPDTEVPDPSQKSLIWERGSYEELLSDKRLADGLSMSLRSYSSMVVDSLAGLTDEQKGALQVVLVARMQGGPVEVAALIREVMNYVPLQGGGFDPTMLNDMNNLRNSVQGRPF